MSRFEEVVNEAIDEVVLAEALQRRGARRPDRRAASATARRGCVPRSPIAARYPETVPTPVSGKPTQEIYTLFGTAVASSAGPGR